jgi:hypothetical protein
MPLPPFLSRFMPGEITITSPLVSLIGVNLVTIVFAILGNWDLASVIFIYWAQSVMIGIFAFLSILFTDTSAIADTMAENPAVPGAVLGGPGPVRTLQAALLKLFLAGFFAVHYGAFHAGYFFFITDFSLFGPVSFDDPGILVSCGLFLAIHAWSFLFYRKRGKAAALGMMTQFMEPYARIFPMHLTIIFGSFIILGLQSFGITTTLPVLVFFLVLKTVADIAAHLKKHAVPEGQVSLPFG